MLDNVEIAIGNTVVTQIPTFSLSKSIDNVGDGFTFTAPFYPEDQTYRDLYKPFQYQRTTLKINGELQLTGRAEVISPALGDRTQVTVKGRSLTGSIVDCTFNQGQDLQFSSAKLDEISQRSLAGFDFKSVFENGYAGVIMEDSAPDSPTQVIFPFLHSLAKQQSLLMSQTPEGDLLYRQARVIGTPVGDFVEGDVGLVVTGASYNGVVRFSEYPTFGQEYDVNDNFAPIFDPRIREVIYRPRAIQAYNTNSANINQAGEWTASSAVAQSINIPLRVAGWRDNKDRLWTENSLINLMAPSIMVYKPYTFLIRAVKFVRTSTEDYTTLGLTIPSAYTGKLPEAYPWD